MKRWIAWILCLSMLCCGLTACKGRGEDVPEVTTKPEASEEDGIKLARYTIVYPSRATNAVIEAAEQLAEDIQALTTDTVKIMSDAESVKDADGKREILIGATNRTLSKEYYSQTPSFRYDVFKREQKIVIAGYTDALTMEAIEFFTEEYVNKSKKAVISPMTDHEKVLTDLVTLSASGSSDFVLAYSRTDTAKYEYFSDILDSVSQKISDRTDARLAQERAGIDYDADRAQILLGRHDYTALSGAYDTLKIGGYTISVLPNKILIAATSKYAYEEVVRVFERLLLENTLYGTKDVSLPIGTLLNGVTQEVFEELPATSVTPNNVLSAGDGAQLAVFEDVTEEFFLSYVDSLLAGGFAEHSSTSFCGDGEKQKNLFGTYVSEKHSVDIGFHENFSRMYLSVSPRDRLTLPSATAPEYTAVDARRYPTILTQIGTKEFHPTEAAMCYLIRLGDGSFILYDTSYGSIGQKSVADEIYAVMKKQAPDPNNIVISAIILTHPHGDHIGGFVQFSEKYATLPSITLKQIVYNFPDIGHCKNTTEREYLLSMSAAVERFGSDVEIVKPRAGNVLYYADVKFNVLYTQENYLAAQDHFDDGNTMSMVTQMVTSDGCKVLFGADHPVKDAIYDGYSFCEGALHRWYGSFLESYVVTVFHHGLGGGADDYIYPTVKPKIVLWDVTWLRIGGPSEGQSYKDGAGKPYSLDQVGYNQYFTSGLEADCWHDTPNAYGVHAWYVADDGVQILTFSGGKATVAVYDERSAYVR